MPWKRSIDSRGLEKLSFLVEISKIQKNRKNDKFVEEGAPALRIIRAGTRLTVYRALPLSAAKCIVARGTTLPACLWFWYCPPATGASSFAWALSSPTHQPTRSPFPNHTSPSLVVKRIRKPGVGPLPRSSSHTWKRPPNNSGQAPN